MYKLLTVALHVKYPSSKNEVISHTPYLKKGICMTVIIKETSSAVVLTHSNIIAWIMHIKCINYKCYISSFSLYIILWLLTFWYKNGNPPIILTYRVSASKMGESVKNLSYKKDLQFRIIVSNQSFISSSFYFLSNFIY